ncbi:hypothetical protein KGQ71_04840 [Patescibacteria group bacterium]|nr:hypothetical protein [Patescibacteria group bacterium]
MKRLLFPLLALVLVAACAGIQAEYDSSSTGFHTQEKQSVLDFSEPLIPSVQALKFISLGDDSLMADMLWLQTIQYFGQGNPYGTYRSLGPLTDTITALDPKFEYPYEFALISLPFMHQTDYAIKIGERAQTAGLNNGRLTFYLASDYQINVKDYKKAAHYYEKAAKQPEAPPAAARLAAVSLSSINQQLNDRLVAADFWQTVADQTSDPDQKTWYLNWRDHMLLVYALEKDASDYKQKYGAYPSSFQDLINRHYISQLPVSPIQRQLVLDPHTGKVSFDRLVPGAQP